jgi:thiol-disulfide isomerase/thioredoxin
MSKINNSIKIIGSIVFLILALTLIGCTAPVTKENKFAENGNNICKEDGKPIIRMYSTNICPHCIWVKPAFDSVAKKYVDENKIVVKHWEWIIDNEGNLMGVNEHLTNIISPSLPAVEEAIFKEFSPSGAVPVFVFGCKYYRLGTQFESQKDLNAEEAEFTRVIEELLKE